MQELDYDGPFPAFLIYVSIPYSSGEKCKGCSVRMAKERACCFNPLFIRGKMQASRLLAGMNCLTNFTKFQSLIHQGKNARAEQHWTQEARCTSAEFQSLIHQGKNARSGTVVGCGGIIPSGEFQSLIHQGKNARIAGVEYAGELMEEFQSLIHQGKNARAPATSFVNSNLKAFQSLIHQGKNAREQ